MFNYYIRYQCDELQLKALVATVFVMETMHQGVITYTIYTYLVTDYANEDALDRIIKALVIMVIMEAVTALIVQSFFAMRIHRLSTNKFVVLPVIALTVTEFCVSVAYAVKAVFYKTFPELAKHKGLSLAMNVSAALTDVTIAAILCTILQRSKTGYERSDRLVNKLMAFTINTGLVTSTCACVSLITYLARPGSFVYMSFFLLMGRLYSNSLLATLNARQRFRDDLVISFDEVSLGHISTMPSPPVHLELGLGGMLGVESSMFDSAGTKTGLPATTQPIIAQEERAHIAADHTSSVLAAGPDSTMDARGDSGRRMSAHT
ncbi:hypothetical protein OH76DRAFT_1484668 [Lentinus brumalis]|uniref:DUF6534 domain-containing protein n=1 Tax=Lentinus brumalis TaxID=2498619 RepID=A0A371D4W0_9APHY|nr:hypothetical protein OH76DRAFT_1484668 [Polyporus brumalis]